MKIEAISTIKAVYYKSCSCGNGRTIETPTKKIRKVYLSKKGTSIVIEIGENKKYVPLEKIEKLLKEHSSKIIKRSDFEKYGIRDCEVLVIITILQEIGIGNYRENGRDSYFEFY